MKVAIMGYGTIGSGVAESLRVNRDVIAKRAGEPLELKYVLDLRECKVDPVEHLIVHDYETIVNDP
jgi:homoserine dehydrogenase